MYKLFSRLLNKIKPCVLSLNETKVLDELSVVTKDDREVILNVSRELYYQELSQQNTNNTFFYTVIGATAICLTGLSFPYTNFLEITSYYTISFIICVICYFGCLICFCSIVYYAVLHQIGLKYQRIPPLLEVYKYIQNSGEDVYDILIDYYSNAAQYNLELNIKKSDYLRALKFLILILVLLESISYISYSFVNKKEHIYNVNLIGVTYMTTNNNNNNSNKQPQPIKRPEPQYAKDEAIKKPQPQYIRESWPSSNSTPKRDK